MYMTDTLEKYHRDQQFKTIVDTLVAYAMQMEVSPGELREAAIFAEIKFQSMHPIATLFPHRYREIDQEMKADERARDKAKPRTVT